MKNKEKIEKLLSQYFVLSSRHDKSIEKQVKARLLFDKKEAELIKSIEEEFPNLGNEVLVIAGKALSIKKRWPHDPSVVIKDLI